MKNTLEILAIKLSNSTVCLKVSIEIDGFITSRSNQISKYQLQLTNPEYIRSSIKYVIKSLLDSVIWNVKYPPYQVYTKEINKMIDDTVEKVIKNLKLCGQSEEDE